MLPTMLGVPQLMWTLPLKVMLLGVVFLAIIAKTVEHLHVITVVQKAIKLLNAVSQRK